MRRFLQFRLRSLLAVMTLLAIGCACVGSILRGRQADLAALAELHANHVLVEDSTRIPLPSFL